MSLSAYQFKLLQAAARELQPADVDPYLKLRALLRQDGAAARAGFCKLFAQYYGLNVAGLTQAWKNRYFELLFAFEPGRADPYTGLLRELYKFPRRQGDRALQFSFVSKLVAMHDEAQPIFDKHVKAFFNLKSPTSGLVGERIAELRAQLRKVRESYESWAVDPQFQPVLAILQKMQPGLAECHPSRLCDFLVWTVGDKKLASTLLSGSKP
jgi:hypothetical protein